MLKVAQPTAGQAQAFKKEMQVLGKTQHVNILLFMGFMAWPGFAITSQWDVAHHHASTRSSSVTWPADCPGQDYLPRTPSTGISGLTTSSQSRGSQGRSVTSAWPRRGGAGSSGPRLCAVDGAEVIRPNPYSFQSDAYAYRVVLYELMTGSLPYSHIDNRDQIILMGACCRLPQVLARGAAPLPPDPGQRRSLPKAERSASKPSLHGTQTDELSTCLLSAARLDRLALLVKTTFSRGVKR
ncbi:LOW QUALITY PROTEIN: hypothetical protein QTO34_015110 [Cnephaeus nilssonii]|uniref:Serine-threonine/tyrosine-protein kinase catalytic domain-containing protein n=1 Tax=Cnephaeus nilssonii TaxID=3371016 RepID=A0AA40LQD9_CNENI|nr:LOW QUALITY PROTEIN: hypothetical protein QTO34_015110 [Eptesicus nilssonii]